MSRQAVGQAAARVLHHRQGGGGDPVILEAFRRNYRFWAALPPAVDAVLFLANPGAVAADDTMLAVVARPAFPAGVCTGCGCSQYDACPGDVGEGCGWVDATRTRCTSCGPAPVPSDIVVDDPRPAPRHGRAPRRGRGRR